MAIEIAPDVGWTKGTALRMIVEHVGGAAVLPLYAGDDANDADALRRRRPIWEVSRSASDLARRRRLDTICRTPGPWDASSMFCSTCWGTLRPRNRIRRSNGESIEAEPVRLATSWLNS